MSTMDRETMLRLREHYSSTDTSAEMQEGRWEDDTERDPMVTTSLRLPKSLLDWVRDQAAGEHVKPTALIRQWVEERRVSGDQSVNARLRRLESKVYGLEQDPDGGKPAMPPFLVYNANVLATYVEQLRDDLGTAIDPAQLMDANTAAETIVALAPQVPNLAVRASVLSLVESWRVFREERVNYHAEGNDPAPAGSPTPHGPRY